MPAVVPAGVIELLRELFDDALTEHVGHHDQVMDDLVVVADVCLILPCRR
jgi:hypothetical protein